MSFKIHDRSNFAPAIVLLMALLSACAGTDKAKVEPKVEQPVSAYAQDPSWTELNSLASRHGYRRIGETPEGRVRLVKADKEVQIDPQSRVSFFNGELVLMAKRPQEDYGQVYVGSELDRNFKDLDAKLSPRTTAKTSPVAAKVNKELPRSGLRGKHFVLDAGHGGKDGGTSGGGINEKNIVLDITMHVGEILKARGAQVTYTRTDDRFIALEERAAISNRARPDAFVSIHVNAAANHAAQGAEVFRSVNRGSGAIGSKLARSAWLAADLEKRISQVTPVKDRGVKNSPGFRVLKLNNHPAVLLELGFLSNPDERSRLANDQYRRRLADAIVTGLEDYSARN